MGETFRRVGYRALHPSGEIYLIYEKDKEGQRITLDFPCSLATENFRINFPWEYNPHDEVYPTRSRRTFYADNPFTQIITLESLEKILVADAVRLLANDMDTMPTEIKNNIWGLVKRRTQ